MFLLKFFFYFSVFLFFLLLLIFILFNFLLFKNHKNHVIYLMTGRVFAVQVSLDGDGAVLGDGELPAPVGSPVDGVGDFTFAALIRIRSPERLQAAAHFRVLVHRRLDVRLSNQRTNPAILVARSPNLNQSMAIRLLYNFAFGCKTVRPGVRPENHQTSLGRWCHLPSPGGISSISHRTLDRIESNSQDFE